MAKLRLLGGPIEDFNAVVICTCCGPHGPERRPCHPCLACGTTYIKAGDHWICPRCSERTRAEGKEDA